MWNKLSINLHSLPLYIQEHSLSGRMPYSLPKTSIFPRQKKYLDTEFVPLCVNLKYRKFPGRATWNVFAVFLFFVLLQAPWQKHNTATTANNHRNTEYMKLLPVKVENQMQMKIFLISNLCQVRPYKIQCALDS